MAKYGIDGFGHVEVSLKLRISTHGRNGVAICLAPNINAQNLLEASAASQHIYFSDTRAL